MSISEDLARAVFEAAIREERCGELLACLFEGGSATVDPNGVLVTLSGDLVAQLAEQDV